MVGNARYDVDLVAELFVKNKSKVVALVTVTLICWTCDNRHVDEEIILGDGQ